jgi:hypothetical protein
MEEPEHHFVALRPPEATGQGRATVTSPAKAASVPALHSSRSVEVMILPSKAPGPRAGASTSLRSSSLTTAIQCQLSSRPRLNGTVQLPAARAEAGYMIRVSGPHLASPLVELELEARAAGQLLRLLGCTLGGRVRMDTTWRSCYELSATALLLLTKVLNDGVEVVVEPRCVGVAYCPYFFDNWISKSLIRHSEAPPGYRGLWERNRTTHSGVGNVSTIPS